MARWSVPIDTIVERTKLDVATVVRNITFDMFAKVALRSPVDTGRFRANWNVSYGVPDYGTTLATNQARATAEAQKALTLPVGGVVYMANGLPYAQRLENGWSKQAPVGMVRTTVAEFDAFVRGAVK